MAGSYSNEIRASSWGSPTSSQMRLVIWSRLSKIAAAPSSPARRSSSVRPKPNFSMNTGLIVDWRSQVFTSIDSTSWHTDEPRIASS